MITHAFSVSNDLGMHAEECSLAPDATPDLPDTLDRLMFTL